MLSLKKTLGAMLFLVALGPATSYALSCKAPNGAESITAGLGTVLAVPADVPDGTIIWESDEITVNVRCTHEYDTPSERIYLWSDPAKASNIGEGIRVGIRYANTIYRGQQKIYTGIETGCNWANCQGWTKDFLLKTSIVIEKYGRVPESGQASTLAKYRLFQVDGSGGLNQNGGNLNYILTGLTNIRFIPCSPDLTITPSVVNFPRAYAGTAENGKVASTAKFTLGLNKSCDTPFTVDAKFTPASGSVISGLLVPPNNSSVGIKLSRVDSKAVIPFSKWFKLADLDRRQPESIDFNADLIWRATPVMGPFEAAVVVDMMYK